jgi:DNA replication and repair protein RecF
MEYGFSLTGPHKDNYLFLINGISFSKYASFGQTRLAALVLKIVQTEFFRNAFNTIPVLLLDDVILELDGEKQRRFIDKISEYQQIFITLTNIDYGKLFNRSEFIKDIEVVNGQIR